MIDFLRMINGTVSRVEDEDEILDIIKSHLQYYSVQSSGAAWDYVNTVGWLLAKCAQLDTTLKVQLGLIDLDEPDEE